MSDGDNRVKGIETYALLLRELVDKWSRAFVLYNRGMLDGLSVATFFAGWCRGRGEFPGGIYLLSTSQDRLNDQFAFVCGKKGNLQKLIIVDDRKFSKDYSLDVSKLLGNRRDISLIVVARDKTKVVGEHTGIDLSDNTEAEIMDLFTLLARSDAVALGEIIGEGPTGPLTHN